MAHPSLRYALSILITLMVRLAFAQGVEAPPLIQGEVDGLKVGVQSVELELSSQYNKAITNSPGDLNRVMWKKSFVKLVLKPGEIELIPVPGSQQPNITIAIPDIDPTPTFSVLPTGIADIDQTSGILFLNNTTLGELAQLVKTIDIEPVPTIERYQSIADDDDDTLTVIDPVPDQERDDLTRIPADLERESLESSAFISPTPVPTVRVEGEGQEARLQLEFPRNITVIQPSLTKGYDGSRSKTYTVSYQPRQVGTISDDVNESSSSTGSSSDSESELDTSDSTSSDSESASSTSGSTSTSPDLSPDGSESMQSQPFPTNIRLKTHIFWSDEPTFQLTKKQPPAQS